MVVAEGQKIVHMTIPDKLHSDLKEYAAKKNISMAAAIRIACSELVEREREKK